MFVHPDYRKQGIAAQILGELETWAKALRPYAMRTRNGQKTARSHRTIIKKQGYQITPNYGQYIRR